MSYVVNKTNGQTLTIIADGTLDTSIGLYLVGRNFKNYGEFTAENFVRLAENFANVSPPNAPLEGQLWWNTQTKTLNVYEGTGFKQVMSGIASPVQPTFTARLGDFWWNSSSNQLFIHSGTAWILVGPQSAPEFPNTSVDIVNLIDTSNNPHPAILLRANGVVTTIISGDPAYTLSTPINTLFTVQPGVNLTGSNKLYGTATNSEQLNNVAASFYVRRDQDTQFTGNIAVSADKNIILGSGNNLQIYSRSGNATVETLATGLDFKVAGTTLLSLSTTPAAVNIPNTPTALTHAANKSYVDDRDAVVLTTNNLYTDNAISAVKGNPPLSLSTVESLASAINNDATFSSTINLMLAQKANLANPIFTGFPRAPTPLTNDNSTLIATTQYVKENIAVVNAAISLLAPNNNPAFTGLVTAPTPPLNDSSIRVATTEFVNSLRGNPPPALSTIENLAASLGNDANFATNVNSLLNLKANLLSPVFTGIPRAPTPGVDESSTQIATTQYVKDNISVVNNVIGSLAPRNSPTFTGSATAPTPAANDNSTRLATTAFVQNIASNLNSTLSAQIQAVVPAGVIVMWSGTINNVPAGWALCNGLNGTPDLRERFVVGASTTLAAGTVIQGSQVHANYGSAQFIVPTRYVLAFIMKL